jgi:DNA polymerase-3 subunit delta'
MIVAPRANPDLLGHEALEASLAAWVAAGRLPHALILGGDSGIGKATLAFRLAKYLLANPASRDANTLAIDPASGASRRVASESHANLITVERHRDPETGKPSKEVAVEDVRKVESFMRLSAGEGGWRIAVVDEAAHLNRAGQNALLKILEEPPARTVLMLVCDRPGMLLPTIHSRCRLLRMAPLSTGIVSTLLTRYAPDVEPADRDLLADLSGGSIGRALDLADGEGLALYAETAALFEKLTRPDWTEIHGFADRLSAPAADRSYRLFGEFAPRWIMAQVRQGVAQRRGDLDRWIDACEKITQRLNATDAANLDRRLAVWSVFETMAASLA